MSQELKELLNVNQTDPHHQDSRFTQEQAFSAVEMAVQTIPNLQVDKIMIRKKRNKSTKMIAGEPQLRPYLRESALSKDKTSEKEQKVEWKIVK